LKPNGKTSEELKAELTEKYPDLVIYTKEDADKWTPENTGNETPSKLFKKAKAAFANGDIEDGKELIKRMEAMLSQDDA